MPFSLQGLNPQACVKLVIEGVRCRPPDMWKAFECLHKGQEERGMRRGVGKTSHIKQPWKSYCALLKSEATLRVAQTLVSSPCRRQTTGISVESHVSDQLHQKILQCLSPYLLSLSGILILISLDGSSVTKILCLELGVENVRGCRLHALQQEQSTLKYFLQASSLSSDGWPIHPHCNLPPNLALVATR